MSSTLLELTRAAHEDYERYERLLAAKLTEKPRNHKETMNQQHRIYTVLRKAQEKAKQLIQIYEDKDGMRKDEIAALGGSNVMSSFYDRLKDIREYHKRFVVTQTDNQDTITLDTEDGSGTAEGVFTAEENFGKNLDLHSHFNRYLNLKAFEKLQPGFTRDKFDYMTYVERLDKFAECPRSAKLTLEYKAYLEDLYLYIREFAERAMPLTNHEKVVKQVDADFEERWRNRQILGWFDEKRLRGGEDDGERTGGAPAQEGIFCSACKKNFGNQNVYDAHLKGKKHEQAVKRQLADTGGLGQGSSGIDKQELSKQIAHKEALIERFVSQLPEQIFNTKALIQKKQSRTYDEIEMEQNEEPEEEVEVEDTDSEEERPIYNPLNLPMGWDGKPIPYWLYKLHGLNIEYKCEICGNYSYWGPRNFDRHFQEWRHAHGMRCLKIPNTKHFHGITLIEDALALYEKIKNQQGEENFKADVEEEYEDAQGNVFSRKTYEDLRRQGII
eukprot:tig00000912_g5422.t1